MGAHQVGDHELLQPQLLVGVVEQFHELLVCLVLGLAHDLQHHVAHVLGGQAQLSAHVVLHQLPHVIGGVAVQQGVVKADTAAHEHLLHPGQRPQFPQKLQVVAVIYL